jgi:uncharacterized protein YfkK (UPF0435 family)
MIKIYVGCGLTHAPEDFKQKVAELKEKLASIPSVQVLKFLGLVDGTAHDVYVHDIINCVCECDIMIAICDEPSTGLGWEMCEQTKRGKPLLAFGHDSSKITRLVLDPQLSSYRFYRYQDFNDIYEIVKDAILVGMHRFI